jgi:threonine/homoserine/homoserine lactone efflux protein
MTVHSDTQSATRFPSVTGGPPRLARWNSTRRRGVVRGKSNLVILRATEARAARNTIVRGAHVPESASLLGFVAAALVVLLIPGPAVLYVLARSVSQGQRAGLVSVLGLSTGALVHVGAATAGLSAVLLTSATAFSVIKALGAGYLVYLGIRTILGRAAMDPKGSFTPRSSRRIFTDGIVVSVLNPKIAVFFLAFLPQFVEPARGPVPQQILLLGLLYVTLALVTDSTYAMLASRLRDWFGGRMMRGPLPRYASGAVYIGLGVRTALGHRN